MVFAAVSKIKWPYLSAIAGGAGIGIGTMVLLLNKEREKFANRATFIENAVNKLREQPEAVKLLGDSFEVGHASLQDGFGKMNNTQVRVRVPIIGKNDNGSLYVYARKKHEKAKYKLFKLEMTFDKVKGKKLILMDLGEDAAAGNDDGEEEEVEVVKKVDQFEEAKKARMEETERKMALLMDPKNHPTLKTMKPATT